MLPFWVNNCPQYSQLNFSLLWILFVCNSTLWAVVKVCLHWLHSNLFGLCLCLMCAFIRPTSPNGWEQCLQVKGTSNSGWVSLCLDSCSLFLNVSEQIWQIFDLTSLCIFLMCWFMLLKRLNNFPHSTHFQGRAIIAWKWGPSSFSFLFILSSGSLPPPLDIVCFRVVGLVNLEINRATRLGVNWGWNFSKLELFEKSESEKYTFLGWKSPL